MKKIFTLFFLSFSLFISAQDIIDSTGMNFDSLNSHKPYYYVYSSWIGYEHFFDDEPLTEWLITQNQGFSKPIDYYKFTILTIDYLPHNRMIIGTSFLDLSCAVPFQGGPRAGGFNVNAHLGIRIHINKNNMLDILCGLKYTTLRVRFDSPPPFFLHDANQYLSSHQSRFEYYSLYNAQIVVQPFIRYSHVSKYGRTFGLIAGYRYAMSEEGWTFNGIYTKASHEFPYTEKVEDIISQNLPSSLQNPVMTKSFYVQFTVGINVMRKSVPKKLTGLYLYNGK